MSDAIQNLLGTQDQLSVHANQTMWNANLKYLSWGYRMRARMGLETRVWKQFIRSSDKMSAWMDWWTDIPRPIAKNDMRSDGDYMWASLAEGGALLAGVITQLTYRNSTVLSMSAADGYVGRATTRLEELSAELRHCGVTDYWWKAIDVIRMGSEAIDELTRCKRCPLGCGPTQHEFVSVSCYRKTFAMLDNATKVMDGMEEQPSTPTLLYISPYEMYSYYRLQAAQAPYALDPNPQLCFNLRLEFVNGAIDGLWRQEYHMRPNRAATSTWLARAHSVACGLLRKGYNGGLGRNLTAADVHKQEATKWYNHLLQQWQDADESPDNDWLHEARNYTSMHGVV